MTRSSKPVRNRSPKATANARRLRRESTEGERILWNRLRFAGSPYRFRRQYPAGLYTLDIYCPECRLCIEIDGEFHTGREEQDKARDEWLAQHGVHTLRVPSWDVFECTDAVVALVFETCERLSKGEPPIS